MKKAILILSIFILTGCPSFNVASYKKNGVTGYQKQQDYNECFFYAETHCGNNGLLIAGLVKDCMKMKGYHR